MVIEHPLVREAFDAFRENLAAQRRRAPVKDGELHTRLIMLEQVANAFESWFKTAIETGKMAEIKMREPKLRIFQR